VWIAKRCFPEAIHTIDIMHVIEKIWEAGQCIHPEGSRELKRWVDRQNKRLYGGKAHLIVAELRRHLEATPRTGPATRANASGSRTSSATSATASTSSTITSCVL